MKTLLRLMLVLVPLLTLAADTNRPALPGDHAYVITSGGLARHYTVHVPPGYDGKSPRPVVIMLHGGGGTGRAAAEETGWGALADREGFLAVFPDALPRDPAKPGSFARNPQLWNDGSGRFYAGSQAPDDVAFLNAVLDDLLAKFAVDGQRLFVTGFSNGASMTFHFGAAAARIAAIAPVAGTCWLAPLKLARPVSMCYLTGTADPLNRLEGGVPQLAGASDKVRSQAKPPVRDSIQKWAQALGCPATPAGTSETNGVRTATYGPGRDGAEVVWVTIANQGHTWAGHKSLLPEFMVGKTTDKLDATAFIWEFFKHHPLLAPTQRPR